MSEVTFTLDLKNPEEAEFADRLYELKKRQAGMIDKKSIKHIATTAAGQKIVIGAVKGFEAGEWFSIDDLAATLQQPRASVEAWVRQIARPEKKRKLRIFARKTGASGHRMYSLTQQMTDTIKEVCPGKFQAAA